MVSKLEEEINQYLLENPGAFQVDLDRLKEDTCKFCKEPCGNSHCPYTEKK